jgi:hypothetical protein
LNNISEQQYKIIQDICKKYTSSLFYDDLVQEVALCLARLDKEIYLDLTECLAKFYKFTNSVAFLRCNGTSRYNKQAHGNASRHKKFITNDIDYLVDNYSTVDIETNKDKLNDLIAINLFTSKEMLFINSLIKNDWNITQASLDSGVSYSSFYYRLKKIRLKVKNYDYN